MGMGPRTPRGCRDPRANASVRYRRLLGGNWGHRHGVLSCSAGSSQDRTGRSSGVPRGGPGRNRRAWARRGGIWRGFQWESGLGTAGPRRRRRDWSLEARHRSRSSRPRRRPRASRTDEGRARLPLVLGSVAESSPSSVLNAGIRPCPRNCRSGSLPSCSQALQSWRLHRG